MGRLRQPGLVRRQARARLNRNPSVRSYNPFVSFDFLQALEESGTVSARSGWTPRHLLLDGEDGPAAVMPCYLKSHSQGEYVFDWGWADAYERAGGRYYPKLQVSVPFTPVTGPRLLARAGPGAAERKQLLAAGLIELCRRLGASSAHLTFLSGRGSAGARRAWAFWSAPTSSSTGRRRLRRFRRLSRRARLAQAQGHPQGAARCAGRRRVDRMGDRARHHRGALGQLLRLLHGYRLAQMGAALTSTAASSRSSASAWPTACCWSWPSAPAATSPAR